MRLFPVIHVETTGQAVEQAVLAHEHGADGIYLIDHHSRSPEPLFDVFNEVSLELPRNFPIGLNVLRRNGLEAFMALDARIQREKLVRVPYGLWVDDIVSGNIAKAMEYKNEHPILRTTQVLGGICFKYTATYSEDPDYVRAQTLALRDVTDVVVTSGAGTGAEPTVAKMRAFREAAGDKRVAVASGISARNIANYEGLIDDVLVSSSIETEKYSGIFIPEKLAEIVLRAHEL